MGELQDPTIGGATQKKEKWNTDVSQLSKGMPQFNNNIKKRLSRSNKGNAPWLKIRKKKRQTMFRNYR